MNANAIVNVKAKVANKHILSLKRKQNAIQKLSGNLSFVKSKTRQSITKRKVAMIGKFWYDFKSINQCCFTLLIDKHSMSLK